MCKGVNILRREKNQVAMAPYHLLLIHPKQDV